MKTMIAKTVGQGRVEVAEVGRDTGRPGRGEHVIGRAAAELAVQLVEVRGEVGGVADQEGEERR